MGSFWNIFGKDGEEGVAEAMGTAPSEAQAAPAEPADAAQQPPPLPRSIAPQVPQLPPKATPPRYGIDDAIKLMRTLPVDENAELVVRVIKQTLASLSVHVDDIIADATSRQEAIRTTVSEYERAIQQFEREIDVRRQEIVRLEQELAETTSVRERLELAEASSTAPPPRAKVAAPSAAPSPMPKRVEPPPIPMAAPRSVAPAPYRPKLGADSKVPPPLPQSGSMPAVSSGTGPVVVSEPKPPSRPSTRPLDAKTRAELAKTVDTPGEVPEEHEI
jgi:hypothetical protein